MAQQINLGELVEGVPTRDHLQKIYEQTGVIPPELVPVDCPSYVRYIFDYWLSIHRRRKGFESIPYMEIFAWSWLRRIRLNAFEMDVLERIEELYFKHFVEPKLEEMKRDASR